MVLITGISGFIGSHLAENIINRDVIGIDNFNDFYNPEIKRKNMRGISAKRDVILAEGDIRDPLFLKTVFNNYPIDMVIHLAAMAGVRPSLKNPLLYEDVNIKGTLNILECMKEFKIKKYIFASSSSVYGEKKVTPFTEDMKIDKPVSFYAATKKACEELNYVYHHLYGINTANLRFFTVYGPRQRPDLAIHKFTKLIYEKKPIPVYAKGEFKRDFTFIDDIIDGVLKSMDFVDRASVPLYDTFNLGESVTIIVNQMIQCIEKHLGIKAQIEFFPAQPGDVPITYADISKAKKVLGYDPKTLFDDGIKKFIDWFLKDREIK